jgi:hypothetical protein
MLEVVGSERAAVAGWAEEEMEVEDLAMGRNGVVAGEVAAAAQEEELRTCSWRLGTRP